MAINPKISSVILICVLMTSFTALAQNKTLNVVYIGDSITAGAGISFPADYPTSLADATLQRMGFTLRRSSNQGHSGYTTLNFLPGTETFSQLENAANDLKSEPGQLVFSIMLGTNDSAIQGTYGAPVAKEDYAKNLKTIIDRLLKDYPGCKVVINHPLWYSPNTYNGAKYLQEGLDRLQSYFTEIDKLIQTYSARDKNRVFLGDTDAFAYFKNNYRANFQAENGNAGIFYLHPNETGAKALGEFWAKAIANVVK